MPRINIETELWSDMRFQNLMIKLGERHRAIGAVVDLWQLAQKYWCPDRRVIPQEVWASSGLPKELIECGLAEMRPEGIYAKGTEKHFNWWFERQAAGRKGGLASVESRRRSGKQSLRAAQARLSKVEQMQPSCSFSSSSSSSQEKNTLVQSVREGKCAEEFESLYSQYPRKEGKMKGYGLYLKLSEVESKQLPVAIKNYANQCREEERKLKHIKLFSSFMAEGFWKDHLTPVTNPKLSDWHGPKPGDYGRGTWMDPKPQIPAPSAPTPQQEEE